MFIFTMFFNLLMLPFTLIGMALRLLGISTHLITHVLILPLKIFARHTVACLIVFAIVVVVIALKRDPHAADNLKPKPIERPQRQQQVKQNGPVPAIQAVTKREDGNSNFATDLYATMTDPEKLAYSQNFYEAMNKTQNGENKVWAYYNINGAFTPTETFLNKTGSTCRRFNEVLKVHTIEQSLSGLACVKADGSWCKLKTNATPACNLGHTPGMFEPLANAIGSIF